MSSLYQAYQSCNNSQKQVITACVASRRSKPYAQITDADIQEDLEQVAREEGCQSLIEFLGYYLAEQALILDTDNTPDAQKMREEFAVEFGQPMETPEEAARIGRELMTKEIEKIQAAFPSEFKLIMAAMSQHKVDPVLREEIDAEAKRMHNNHKRR